MSAIRATQTLSEIDVLIDGRRTLDRIIDCIDRSQRSIAIKMFIWRDDPAGNRVAESLLNAANRGVRITIAKDQLGALFELGEENRQSFFHKEHGPVIALKQRVINAFSSRPDLWSFERQKPNELVVQMRQHANISIIDGAITNDHSKFTIIDDKILFVGGMNFEERIVSTDANGLVWHDYMIECIGGHIVDDLKARLSGEVRPDAWLEFVLNDNSTRPRFEIRSRIVAMLNDARRVCRIEMAYFCDPGIRDCVIRAAQRGVTVEILVPAWANIQNERNLRTMREIFSRTGGAVSIYLCPDMLHSKMMDIDERTMIVGSANFNERALDRFSELNVLLSGAGSHLARIRRTFAQRRAISRKITRADDLVYRKVKERCEYFFG